VFWFSVRRIRCLLGHEGKQRGKSYSREIEASKQK
jgi:hypothetical protein